MFVNADDRGFVDIAQDLINVLEKNDADFDNKVSLDLLENSYQSALSELIDKGYLYEFKDKHRNKIYLIRHWFFHNRYIKGLWTNYSTFLGQVHLENNEYILGRKPLKEDINENNINDSKLNEIKDSEKPKKTIDDFTKEELDKMSEDEFRELLPM